MTLIYGYIFYYISAMIGISIGYHRYFTHNSFKTNKFFEIVFLLFGLICGGRSALTWCAVHRYHHGTSDTETDPHSPKFKGRWNVIFSRWNVKYIPKKYLVPLLRNPRLIFFHNYGIYIYAIYGLIMLLIGIHAFVIFVVSPFVLSWISFGLLNYVAHKDGTPQNVPLMNILAPGEGWHKVHHDYPNKYRLNRFDPAGWLIEKIST